MLYILIPTFNERENLSKLVVVITQNLEKSVFKDHYRVLIIDDNSPDGTGQLAESLKDKYPLEVLHRSGKLGLGSAYREGFNYALMHGAEYVMEMDADFSHQPQDILRLVEACQKEGVALVIGSRKIKGGKILGWNWRRKFYSNGAMYFARTLLNLKTHDITAGFRCFRANELKKISYHKIRSNGYAFQVEMIYKFEKAGLKIIELPVIFPDRISGDSKLNWHDIREFFIIIIKLFLRLNK